MIFIAGLKILVNNLGSLVVTSAVAPAGVLSTVWYLLFFSLRSIEDLIKKYILNDLRLGLKDDIIEAIMFQRCNTQTFCLPYF